MERFDLGNIFQGISTLLQADSAIMYARIGLILLGILWFTWGAGACSNRW